jgi:hypothetical protein
MVCLNRFWRIYFLKRNSSSKKKGGLNEAKIDGPGGTGNGAVAF